MSNFQSTKLIELGSCAFRQPNAAHNRVDAGENSQRCSFVHGYQLKAKFWFGCDHLDDKNWAVDFGALKELKAIMQHQFDHTTCIDAQDPLLSLFQQLHDAGGCDLRVMDGVGIEKTAEWCFNASDKYVRKLTDGRCWVDQVEVFEHELNSVVYSCPQSAVPQLVVNEVAKETAPAPASAGDVVLPVTTTSTPTRHAAHVGPNVSSGKGDWFAGTTWGNK